MISFVSLSYQVHVKVCNPVPLIKLVSDFCRDIQLCTLCVFVEISFRRHYSICQYSQIKCTPRIALHLDIHVIDLICHIRTIGQKNVPDRWNTLFFISNEIKVALNATT